MTNDINVEPFVVMETNIEEILSLDESLSRLLNNPDFQKVFIKHYLGKFILEKSSLLNRSNVRPGIMEALVGTSYFKSFITDIHQRAEEYRLVVKKENIEDNTPFGDSNE